MHSKTYTMQYNMNTVLKYTEWNILVQTIDRSYTIFNEHCGEIKYIDANNIWFFFENSF